MGTSGRANRAKFMIVAVTIAAACLAVGVLAGLLDQLKVPGGMYIYLAAVAVWAGLSIAALLQVGARRLHDLDQSAWWLLLLLIPYINIAALIALAVIPGNPRANRFGELPII